MPTTDGGTRPRGGRARSPVSGPAGHRDLEDAPLSVKPAGVDDDLLIVHQQDIQAVVNALWAGGAEAMTIQDQRVTTRTGIKCVGNTVVLHGVPYAPPYVIARDRRPRRLEAALAGSPTLRIYRAVRGRLPAGLVGTPRDVGDHAGLHRPRRVRAGRRRRPEPGRPPAGHPGRLARGHRTQQRRSDATGRAIVEQVGTQGIGVARVLAQSLRSAETMGAASAFVRTVLKDFFWLQFSVKWGARSVRS